MVSLPKMLKKDPAMEIFHGGISVFLQLCHIQHNPQGVRPLVEIITSDSSCSIIPVVRKPAPSLSRKP